MSTPTTSSLSPAEIQALMAQNSGQSTATIAGPSAPVDSDIPSYYDNPYATQDQDPQQSPGPSQSAQQVHAGLSAGSSLLGAASNGQGATGDAGDALGIAAGLDHGGVQGYGNAAIDASKLYNNLNPGNGIPGAGALGSALGVYNGIQRGGALGYTGAGLSAASLANNIPGVNIPYVGGLSAALGVVNGIKQGGVAGYGSAALNGYNLYNAAAPVVNSLINGGTAAADAAGSGAAGAAGAGLGTTAGTAAAIAAPLAMTYSDLSSVPYTLSAGWWNNMGKSLTGDSGPQQAMIEATSKSMNIPLSQAQDMYATQAQRGLVDQYISNSQGGDSSIIGGNKGATIPASVIAQYPGGATAFYKAVASAQAGGGGGDPGGGHSNALAEAPYVKKSATGGKMDFRDIYKSSFADRKRHFDDGGYVDYVYPSYHNETQPAPDPVSPGDVWNPSGGQQDINNYSDPSAGYDPNSGALAALQKALGSGGKDVSSALSALKGYAPLLPLIASLTGAGKAKAPALPSQYAAPVLNIPTPSYTRTQNPALAGKSTAYWEHAAENAPQQFYTNNALPSTAVSPPTVTAPTITSPVTNPVVVPHAMGGAIHPSTLALLRALKMRRASGGPIRGGDPMQNPYDQPSHSYIRGPGDGTSDDVNAKLSNGEYVVDAPTVSLLGNGSNEAGAKALDQFRHRVRTHAGKKLAAGKQPMHAAAPDAYMAGAIS